MIPFMHLWNILCKHNRVCQLSHIVILQSSPCIPGMFNLRDRLGEESQLVMDYERVGGEDMGQGMQQI